MVGTRRQGREGNRGQLRADTDALTSPDSVKGAPAESSESAGDGAPDEIEITSAMIEAGVKEFFANRDLEIATPESAVFAIFMAMIGESPALHSIPVVDRSE
jgi:hypothetical protein